MATSEPRQVLQWEIHKKLLQLNASQLYQLAATLDNEDDAELSKLSEPGLFYHISDYIKSEKLQDLEDAGMSRLLHLQDTVNEMTATNPSAHSRSSSPTDIPVPPMHTTGNEDTDSHTPPTHHVSVNTGGLKTHIDQVVRITDVTALLPRREFKIQGGQISDSGSEISYTHIGKQIDEAIENGITESEIVRAVLRVTKGGLFKEYLTNKDHFTVIELKKVLRTHIRDKSSRELLQELSNTKQQDRETPQQFVYRIMALRERVLLAAEQNDIDFSYDKKLVQGVFLHTLYQGLSEKNNNIRHDLKPYLAIPQVSDETILEQITRLTSEEAERAKRFLSSTKGRPVTVSAAQHPGDAMISSPAQPSIVSEVRANAVAITELSAQVSALTKNLEKCIPYKPDRSNVPPMVASTVQSQRTSRNGKCQECQQNGYDSCSHCFRCGQSGHRAVGCLNRSGSGNGRRSWERDGL